MADNVEVKLGADSSGLKSGAYDAAAAVEASAERMRQQMARMAEVAAAASAKFDASSKQIGSGAQKMGDDVKAGTDKAEVGLSSFEKRLIRMGATAVGAFIGHQAIRSIIEFQDGVDKLQRTFDVTSDKAVHMSIALRLAGSSADQFNNIAFSVGRNLRTQQDEFERLGVKIKDSSGNLLPMEEVLKNVYARMLDFKAGADQTEFALALTGRSAKDFGETMENLERVQAQATALQKELNIQMGEDAQAAIKQYKTDTAALSVSLDALAIKIGADVLPALGGLAKWLSEEGPTAANAFVAVLKGLATVWTMVSSGVRTLAITAAAAFEEIVVFGQWMWDSLKSIFSKGGPSLSTLWEQMKARQLAISKEYNASILANEIKTADAIEKLWGKAPKVSGGASDAPKGGSERWTPKPKGGGGAEVSRIGEWEAELKAQRDTYERMKLEQGSFERWSEEQTAAYWKNIIDTQKLSDKERQSVVGKYYDAERVVRQRGFESQIASLEAEKAAFKYNYDERIRIAQQEADMIAQAYGRGSKEAIAAEQRVTQEKQRQADQRMAISRIETNMAMATAQHGVNMEKSAIEMKLALNQISVQQALAMETALENQIYALKVQELEKERALAGDNIVLKKQIDAQLLDLELRHQQQLTDIQNKAILDRMQFQLQAESAIKGGFETLISDLLTHTKTAKQAFLDFAQTVTAAFTRMVAQQWMQQIFGGGTAGGGFLSSILGMFSGGGGGFPFPSFDVGTAYVPQDTLAMVHKGERIIPAAQNRTNSAGIGAVNMAFHLSGPVDTRTQEQIARAAFAGMRRAQARTG